MTKKCDLVYCPRDYANHHRWERRGISGYKLFWQCTQCGKWKIELIQMDDFVEGGFK